MATAARSITRAIGVIVFLTIAAFAGPAHAWGDEGHEIIAIMAWHYFRPAVAAKVDAMLSSDTANVLTANDMASFSILPLQPNNASRSVGGPPS